MVKVLVQYLAIYNNEHLPNTMKNGQSRFKILPNMKGTLKKLPKILKYSTKWRNFAKSGNTDYNQNFSLPFFVPRSSKSLPGPNS